MNRKAYRKGSTIIEVLIAATLISIAILAALSLSSSSEKQTNFSKDINRATIYNNEAGDWFRNMRSLHGWDSFVNEIDRDTATNTATYCLNTLSLDEAAFVAITGGACTATDTIVEPDTTVTKYSREAVIDLANQLTGSIKITLTTSWPGQTEHSVSSEMILTQWVQ